jgi:hypothetical protein
MPYLFEVTIERELTDDTLREFHHVVAEDIQDVATDFLRDYLAEEIVKIERHVSISRNIQHQD